MEEVSRESDGGGGRPRCFDCVHGDWVLVGVKKGSQLVLRGVKKRQGQNCDVFSKYMYFSCKFD
jgi:hypothetical protein